VPRTNKTTTLNRGIDQRQATAGIRRTQSVRTEKTLSTFGGACPHAKAAFTLRSPVRHTYYRGPALAIGRLSAFATDAYGRRRGEFEETPSAKRKRQPKRDHRWQAPTGDSLRHARKRVGAGWHRMTAVTLQPEVATSPTRTTDDTIRLTPMTMFLKCQPPSHSSPNPTHPEHAHINMRRHTHA